MYLSEIEDRELLYECYSKLNKCKIGSEYNYSINEKIKNEVAKHNALTGIMADTILLSEEYYGALVYENTVFKNTNEHSKAEFFSSNGFMIMGLKIKRCESYHIMVVYKSK